MNRGEVLKRVTRNGLLLEFLSKEWQGDWQEDREVVMAAVAENGWVLGVTSEELRGIVRL